MGDLMENKPKVGEWWYVVFCNKNERGLVEILGPTHIRNKYKTSAGYDIYHMNKETSCSYLDIWLDEKWEPNWFYKLLGYK